MSDLTRPWAEAHREPGEVLDLAGKYYGTRVDIGHTTVTVWDHSEHTQPSRRELDNNGHKGREWDELSRDERFDITCDTHYETQADYDLARLIAAAPKLLATLESAVDAINGVLIYHGYAISTPARKALTEASKAAQAAIAEAKGEV